MSCYKDQILAMSASSFKVHWIIHLDLVLGVWLETSHIVCCDVWVASVESQGLTVVLMKSLLIKQ